MSHDDVDDVTTNADKDSDITENDETIKLEDKFVSELKFFIRIFI